MQRHLPIGCLVFSGAAGLIYEVCWIRRASLVFGSTTYSLSTVLAVFFLGLALGSWAFGRAAARIQNPLRMFAILELSLAVLALASLPLFGWVDGLYGSVLRSAGESRVTLAAARVALVGAILLPPTVLMGGTLPLFCRQMATDDGKIAGTVGLLYGANTAGAVLGCAATGFWLIPTLGLTWSVRVAAALNVLAAVGVLALRVQPVNAGSDSAEAPEPATERPAAQARKSNKKAKASKAKPAESAPPSPPDPSGQMPSGQSPASPSKEPPGLITALFFLTGFIAIGMQVLWTRYLSLLVHNTVYTYTLTLTAVLLGIVIGSLIGALFLDRATSRARLFGTLQVLLGVGILAAVMTPAGTWTGFSEHLGIYFALLLPPAVLSGLAFPLAIRMVTSRSAETAAHVGRMTAANTLGGITGSLAVGFGLLPALGLQLSFAVLTGLSMAIGYAAWWLLDAAARPVKRIVWTLASALVWIGIPPATGTELPADFLAEPGTLIDYEEGFEANLALVAKEDNRHLEIDRWWQGWSRKGHQVMAAHTPMLLHDGPQRVLVVGVGVGQTSERFLMYDIEQLDCIDIEPRVFDFVREHFDSEWMDDPRVTLIEADGRNHLAHRDRTYDVISLELGQVSRPGVASFYTREFYADARAKLEPGGLVSQFVPLAFLAPDMLRTVVATFIETFPESVLWYNTTELLLIGTNADALDPMRLRTELLDDGGAVDLDLRYAYWGGEAHWLKQPQVLRGGLLIGSEGLRALSEGAPILSDDRPVLEYATWSIREAEANELPVVALLEKHLSPVEDPAVEAARAANLGDLKAAVYIRRFRGAMAAGDNGKLQALIAQAHDANPQNVEAIRLQAVVHFMAADMLKAETWYRRGLAIRPADEFCLRGLALVLHNGGRYAEAVIQFRALLKLFPDDADAHNNIAVSLNQLGDYNASMHHLEQAVRLKPDLESARRNLEGLRRALGQQR